MGEVDLHAFGAVEERLWKRPVCIRTESDGKGVLMRYDGKEHTVVDTEA
jgi:hypothetical protein